MSTRASSHSSLQVGPVLPTRPLPTLDPTPNTRLRTQQAGKRSRKARVPSDSQTPAHSPQRRGIAARTPRRAANWFFAPSHTHSRTLVTALHADGPCPEPLAASASGSSLRWRRRALVKWSCGRTLLLPRCVPAQKRLNRFVGDCLGPAGEALGQDLRIFLPAATMSTDERVWRVRVRLW